MTSYNFSYTGAKGVHFCKDCLCKLSYLTCLKKSSRLLRQVMKAFGKILMKNEAFSKLNFVMLWAT